MNRENIIGEERVGIGIAFAEGMVQEAERMWASTGWKHESAKDGVFVESKPVSGVFESANILVMRSKGEVIASHDSVFEFFVSPAGNAILDPVSKPEDHELPHLETYRWREKSRLEAATVTAKIPFTTTAEFVVLNAIDYSNCIFVSKSIIHDSMPGGSRFCNEFQVSNARPRAFNTFAIKLHL